MTSYRTQIIHLLKQIAFIFLLYTVCRLLFYFFNYSSFHDISFSELLSLMFFGLKFDSFSIVKVEENLLDEVERYYITKYNPIYNSVKYKHHMPGECTRMSMWRVIK